MRMPRILFLTPYLPYPPDFGGAARIFHLIREVRAAEGGGGYETVTLTLADPATERRTLSEAEAALGRIVAVPVPLTARRPPDAAKRRAQLRSLLSPRSFQDAFYRHPAAQRALQRIIREEHIDLVQFEFSQMGRYRVPAGIPTVLDVHNIEHDVLRQVAAGGPVSHRLFNYTEAWKFGREERDAWCRASRCLATSAADAAAIEMATGRPAEIVPNGVDLARFPRLPASPATGADSPCLVFVGALRYRPNAEAARWAAGTILPRVRERLPGATLALVGADPPPEVVALGGLPGVTVSGTVPDVRPWVERADIVVVPLRSGGGTRLKILEAFALGRPVVSTPIGAAGLEVRDSEHLLLADDPEQFAAAVARLTADATLRERLVERAYALVRERYQWSAIAKRLLEVYADVIGMRRTV